MNTEWRFAVSCVMEGRPAALSDATQIDSQLAFQALNYGLSYSRHDDPERCGYISPSEARAVMKARGSDEPADAGGILQTFMRPMPVKPEGSREHWPINKAYGQESELAAWGLILGIERGWFSYDRAGFLHWSQAGRDRYHAAATGVLIDSVTGQSGFMF